MIIFLNCDVYQHYQYILPRRDKFNDALNFKRSRGLGLDACIDPKNYPNRNMAEGLRNDIESHLLLFLE